MLSLRYRSAVFKLLLAALLAVFVASYSADAAPTGKPAKSPAKAALGGTAPKPVVKAPLKGPAGGAGKTSQTPGKKPAGGKMPPLGQAPGGTKPGNKNTPGKGTGTAKQCLLRPRPAKGRLFKRTGVNHPDGKTPVVLFHGTRATDDAVITSLQKPDLKKTNDEGDLHDKSVCGGFYLTDSIITAAQFACHHVKEVNHQMPEKVRVLSYQWNPPADVKIFNYAATVKPDDVGNDKCKANGMITSPMHNLPMDKDLTTEFYQYAIVQQTLLDSNLQHLKTYTIPCAAVPKGQGVSSEDYTAGQAASAGFEAFAQGLESGSGC